MLTSLTLASAVAGLLVLSLVTSGSEGSLPTFGWAAAFLFAVVEEDVRRMRIPNWLTLPALAGALTYAAWVGGWTGLLYGLGGAAAGFALLFGPFAARWLGAGDVKAVMVLGALWGASVVLGLVWWMVLAGGLLGFAVLTVRGGLSEATNRWFRTVHMLVAARKFAYFPPGPEAIAAGRMPFGVAIALGVAGYQLWGVPWA
jgi:prepilin peptidase CpaA